MTDSPFDTSSVIEVLLTIFVVAVMVVVLVSSILVVLPSLRADEASANNFQR